MVRISFRQSMLAGFLLIVALLSWAAIRSWLTLEHFVEQSRRGSEQALQLSAAIQELSERTVDLERSGRQFMILEDADVLARFDDNLKRALGAIARLESMPASAVGTLPEEWRKAVEQLSAAVHVAPAGPMRASELLPMLSRINDVNRDLGVNGRRWIDDQRLAVLSELEQSRMHLTRLVVAAVLGALLIALTMSWWLSRPIDSIERSIKRLGENELDKPITVRGPADLRRLGRRLDWLRRRLGELESERERMLRHVSHELKTPLTALREGIALLQEEVVGPLDGSQKEVVDILQHNVVALQRQIENLLRLNAAASEARRLCYRPVALRKLLADVVEGRELQIQARRLTVLRDAPGVTRPLDGDKLLVVLDNLLSNAIEFSPEGGVVRLEAAVQDNTVRFACIDQGPGIAQEEAERIFQPFVQGSRASPTPRHGSGVGLSIVRELMTAMGGRAFVVPSKGNVTGANFRIEVPCEQAI